MESPFILYLRKPLKTCIDWLKVKILIRSLTEINFSLNNFSGKIPIIGVGGVSNGRDAFDKIKAGASLVQLYSAFVYQGPPVVYTVASELATLLRENGFENVQQAVGVDAKKWSFFFKCILATCTLIIL